MCLLYRIARFYGQNFNDGLIAINKAGGHFYRAIVLITGVILVVN
jgi:hypothetical protein